ncbi:hypothetical protein EMPS_08311 [Entomortierella parvispora]|uniref:Uncharacterized protein n=1 Tax=Entomortierella parvispora TaxID=205924 RepID=A0A9P3LZ99_9FUNG|nr:hypothetical protein EMPS_08311 [Entomortierella parvispora]
MIMQGSNKEEDASQKNYAVVGVDSQPSVELKKDDSFRDESPRDEIKGEKCVSSPVLPAQQRPNARKGLISPENSANVLSRITLWWLNGLFAKGYKRRIEEDDLYLMLEKNRAHVLCSQLTLQWEREKKRASLKNKTPSLIRATVKTFWGRYYDCLIGLEMGDACQISTPLMMQQVITFINNTTSDHPPASWHGYGLAVGMMALTLVQNVLYQRWNLGSVRLGILIRAALIDMTFRKATTLSARSHLLYPDGRIVNLMSTDASRIDTAMLSIALVISVPIYTIVVVGLLVHLMGPSALLGAALLILMNPVQGWAMSKLGPIRKRASEYTDSRIKLTSEILQGIKVIKFFAWEASFLQKLSDIRRNELKNVGKLLYIRGAVAATSASLPVFASALSFVLYASLGNELKSSVVFPALAFFTVLRVPLMVLPSAYTATVDSYVAMKRIQTFLLSEETATIPPPDPNHEFALSMKNASFKWEHLSPETDEPVSTTTAPSDHSVLQDDSGDSGSSDDATVMSQQQDQDIDPVSYLHRLNVQIPRGSLVAVVGPVGSGKSSLLQAMIGNMTMTEGEIVRGTNISYASQTAWIQNATIRDNILFDTPYDKERYEEVIRSCALEQDLALFPFGDQTEIGERGVNLSGGQKARLSLARTVYFRAGMVILDDPLSAVDAHVGKRLWEDCVLKTLKDRTRVMATHQLHVLPDVDYILCMKNGSIAEEGTFKDLMANEDGEFSALMTQYGGLEDDNNVLEEQMQNEGRTLLERTNTLLATKSTDSNDENGSGQERISLADTKIALDDTETGGKEELTDAAKQAQKKLMSEEERESGAVKGNVYKGYLKASGRLLWVAVFGFFLLQQFANVMGNQWMSWWSEERYNFPFSTYLSVYVVWAVAQLVLVFIAALLLSYAVIKTSYNMHDEAFKKVLYSPLAFFDTTPMGRILNRFSRDVDTLDNILWTTLYESLITVVTLIGTMTLVATVFPWLILAIVPLLGVYYALSIYYRSTSREVKRLDSNLRSHLYAYFSESLTGLGTLKAFGVVNKAIVKNEDMIDYSNSPYYMFQMGSRWITLRVNVLGAILTFSTVVLMVATRKSINPAAAGLVLSYLARISGDLNWGVQRLSMLENNMNSAERLAHYIDNLQQERAAERPEGRPPTTTTVAGEANASWPNAGVIEFRKVTMRYRPELPPVLRNVSFGVHAAQKLAVVGRTGAGKSSLIQALFLLSELDQGQILIDGVDTQTLGTVDLRSSIGIIPQDPVLFQGTVRYNLDPLARHTEQELWQVLETSDLKTYVQSQEGGLDAMISAQGENLSVGQRQLVCLSRALLAKSKVVVLDEATASVDMATDALIQKAIRLDFASSTVITIAHRINTIIDYDRILVMDQGQVAEYDSPRNLLLNPDSVFTSLVNETGPQNAAHLRSLAGL